MVVLNVPLDTFHKSFLTWEFNVNYSEIGEQPQPPVKCSNFFANHWKGLVVFLVPLLCLPVMLLNEGAVSLNLNQIYSCSKHKYQNLIFLGISVHVPPFGNGHILGYGSLASLCDVHDTDCGLPNNGYNGKFFISHINYTII